MIKPTKLKFVLSVILTIMFAFIYLNDFPVKVDALESSSYLEIDGIKVIENLTIKASEGEGWKYNASKNMLMLKNYVGKGIKAYNMGHEFYIYLSGINQVNNDCGDGICVLTPSTDPSSLKIFGKGVLYSTGKSSCLPVAGIYVQNGDFFLSEATVYATGENVGTTPSCTSYGIYAYKEIKISYNATVLVKSCSSESEFSLSYGLYSKIGEIDFSGCESIGAFAEGGKCESYAIRSFDIAINIIDYSFLEGESPCLASEVHDLSIETNTISLYLPKPYCYISRLKLDLI